MQKIIYNWKSENYFHWLFFNSLCSRKIWDSKIGSYVKRNINSQRGFRKEPTSFWEWYFLNTKPAVATRKRKIALTDLITVLIGKKGHICNILDVGAGNGEIVITALEQAMNKSIDRPDINIYAKCIDINQNALEDGRQYSFLNGLWDKVEFLEINMWDFPKYSGLYDIVILSGITCPMDDHGMEIILKKYRKWINMGGYIVVTNISRRIFSLVPLLIEFCSQKNIIGEKKLQYKSAQKVNEILKNAGYKEIETFEVGGYHTIGIGKKYEV